MASVLLDTIYQARGKKTTIHQATTMLATSENILFQVITTCWRLGDNKNVGVISTGG